MRNANPSMSKNNKDSNEISNTSKTKPAKYQVSSAADVEEAKLQTPADFVGNRVNINVYRISYEIYVSRR